jgi:crotonobetainyl-CoA:carnitine CoA-transferase CaiB-like acyl-CoA transferase
VTGPLAGLRVVELGSEIAAPYCTKLLVDLGADVCKIEPPSGDPLRRWGPFAGVEHGSEGGGLFEYLNAGKHGATIDLGRPHDTTLAHELIRRADLLVENLPPGLPDRQELGLDKESLQRLNPHLVVVRVSDFGQEGPLRDRQSTPLTMQAAAGWISARDPDRAPV